MMERTCFYCDQSMPAGTHPRRKYCNDQCKWKEARDGATLANRETVSCRHCEETFTRHTKDTWHTYCSNICQALHEPTVGEQCDFPGCARKREAGNLCTSHYGMAWKKFTKKFTRTCSQCGDTFGTAKQQATEVTFCSEPCRMKYMTAECSEKRAESNRRTHYARYSNELVPYVKPKRKLQPPAEVKGTGSWKSCLCYICGTHFITKNIDITCSEHCAAKYRQSKKREYRLSYRARKKGAFVAPVSPRGIYARDNYTCHICGDTIDMSETAPAPSSPVIDHVIPLAKGGTHEPNNCKAAHFICNSVKRDRLDYVA